MNLFFHYGALGDFALTLPILRRLKGPTTVITAWPRATLASRLIHNARPMDSQMWEFVRLHAEGGPTSVSPAVAELFEQAHNVISFISTGKDDWAINVKRLAPRANHVHIDPRPDDNFTGHITDWLTQQATEQHLNLAPPVEVTFLGNTDGPVAIHPGSGGEEKCWPADRFESLIQSLTKRGQAVRPLLGEAEAERWPDDVLNHWQTKHNAQLFASLDQLHTALTESAAYVGNDSGPTHLAAQLGLPTIALFGPTNPTRWAPLGPNVTTLAPPKPAPMDWLDIQTVLNACPPAHS